MQDLKTTAEQQTRSDCAATVRLIALYGRDDMIFMRVPAFPDSNQSARTYVRRIHGVFAGQGGRFRCGHSGDSSHDQTRRLRHSFGHLWRPQRRSVRHPPPHGGWALRFRRRDAASCRSPKTRCSVRRGWLITTTKAQPSMSTSARLASDLGNKKLMILRNHGTLSAGLHAADAFLSIYLLERACEQQVAALTEGPEQVLEALERARSQTAQLNPGKGLRSVSGHRRALPSPPRWTPRASPRAGFVPLPRRPGTARIFDWRPHCG
jgi:hypothetical protein